MTNKRDKLNKDSGRGTPVKKTRKNLANATQTPPLAGASSSVPEEATEVAQGLRKTNHGVIFQLKLLMLFLIRGIRAGHAFRLGTEMEDIGGKFDDIIFQYEVDDGGKRQVNRYLQAKHKQDESTKITAGQLFNETEGDFSLLKYFSSYCGILSRGDDIQDCIICTNIGFNSENLLKKEIQLITVNTDDEMFKFRRHPVARYKIEIDPGHAFWGKLRQVNVEEPATKLKRNATDNEINSFFDKLVFVVNTPNEVHLGNLLTEEVGEYYKLNKADFQSDFILRNMLDWFKLKKSEFLTSKQGQEILHQGEQKLTSLRMTSVSINYQTKLQEAIEFNAVAIDEMTEKLKTLLDSPNKIERIRTAFPKRTAVKVSAALKTLEKFKRDDSYLMSSSKGLKTTSASNKDAFKLEHQLLVVVCKDGHAEHDSYYENLIGDNQTRLTNKKVIILCHDVVETRDDLKFTQLSDNCMEKLLDKEVSFQGTVQTVRKLTKIGNREEVIDDNSMEELLVGKKVVNIPLHDFVPAFDEELYIEREIILPFDDTFFYELVDETYCTKDELLGKLRVTVENNIEWFVDDREKQELWLKIKKIFEKRRHSTDSAWLDNRIPEKDLTPLEEWENRVVVVSDVAGTGKSTMLSNYYRKMRNEKPDNWIIKMDLVDHIGALRQFNSDEVDQKVEAIKFFIANIPNVRESPFAQSLLRHKLQTGDGIVVMLDGFDEIPIQCQDKCISLIEAIRLTNLNALYITTRPHLNRKLQDSLFQLAYTLRDFSQEDQINYLSGYWKKQLKVDADAEVRSIATSIVERLSKSLKGNERSFIGIPLQCHIVADCFESQVDDIIQNGCKLNALLKDLDSNLNLDTLYGRLFKKKREIYRQEKAKVQQVNNHILHNSLEDHMECLEIYLRDLAVKTIVSDQTHIDCLLGKSNESAATIEKQYKKREEGSVCFGLLTLNRKGEFQFLHRTYAEYLMANYLYGGFRLDEDLRNKLLDEKPTRELIGSEILVGLQYQGVQLFIDCMLHEMVNHEKWRTITDPMPKSELPENFTHLTNDFYRVFIEKGSQENAVTVAIERYHANIFELFSRFIDLTIDKSEILKLIKPLFKQSDLDVFLASSGPNFLTFFYERKHDGLQRFIDWHDGSEENNIYPMIQAIHEYAPNLKLHESRLSQEENKIFFSPLLDFMIKHQKIVQDEMTRLRKQFPRFMFSNWHKLLIFFLNHECYKSLLKPLFQLVLRTAGDVALVQVVNEAFTLDEDVFKQAEVEKLANALREMELTNVLIQLPWKMFVSAPNRLQWVYNYHHQNAKSKWLPEKNSLVMTELHNVTYQGETKNLQVILETVSRDLLSNVPETKKAAEGIVHYMTYRYGTNPYTLAYLAAVYGQEEMFRVMLQFVKEVLPDDELQTALISKNGFLHGAFWDAMTSGKIETLQLIMKAVKEIMGPESQLTLVKSMRSAIVKHSRLINILAKTMTEDDPVGFEFFNTLIFHDERNLNALEHIDAQFLSKSISAEGRVNWMKRLLDAAIKTPGDFISLLPNLLDKFSNEELECFLTMNSKWAKLVRGMCKDHYAIFYANNLEGTFKCVLRRLGAQAVEQLIFCDNGQLVEWIALGGYTQILDVMLAALPAAAREQIEERQANNEHQKMFDKFLSAIPMDWNEHQRRYRHMVPVTRFCLLYGSKEQLSEFANSATSVYCIQEKKFSIWNTFANALFTREAERNKNREAFVENMAKILDAEAIKILLLHDIGKGAFLVRLMLWEGTRTVWAVLDLLPADLRELLDIYMKDNGPDIVQKIFFSSATEKLIAKMRKQGRNYSINILQFYLDYGNEKQLALFMDTITASHWNGSTKRSAWGTASLLRSRVENALSVFLRCVAEKLGKDAVKKLVLHKDKDDLSIAIVYALRKNCLDIYTTMLTLLDDEGRNEAIRLVDYLLSNADIKRYGGTLTKNWGKVKKRMNVEENEASLRENEI
ncbi:uncharacterized protein LOC116920771 [Daphnia magna]|uniref:uncharacterized protein LOC116920771 n=1 Tax=Daphnia magna TaxID=35525 RepID=UPI001E1BD441|nr:uncharacterized protein LOC116920771 [Daphnia magna]